MVDEKTHSMLDLEAAKDKLRQSLTLLEQAVEKKIKDAQERVNAMNDNNAAVNDETLKKELINAKTHLEKMTKEKHLLAEEKSKLEQSLLNAQQKQQQLKEKNRLATQRVDKLIIDVEQTLNNREAHYANS